MHEQKTKLIGVAVMGGPLSEDITRMRDEIFSEEEMELLSVIRPKTNYR